MGREIIDNNFASLFMIVSITSISGLQLTFNLNYTYYMLRKKVLIHIVRRHMFLCLGVLYSPLCIRKQFIFMKL